MERIKLFFSGIWDFLKPLIEIFLSEAGKLLAASAMQAVTTVAATMGEADGEAKRKAAFDMIVADLKKQGVTLGVSVINAGIETAVQKLEE